MQNRLTLGHLYLHNGGEESIFIAHMKKLLHMSWKF